MTDWIVQDWFPAKHRVMDTAPEGCFKTIRGAYLAVCIASGSPFLGQAVKQGKVLIIDEETPEPSLVSHLSRFALSLGIKDWHELPIDIEVMRGFRFGRKAELGRIIEKVQKYQPTLIRMDSVLAMLPTYRQGLVENDSSIGTALREDMNQLLSFTDFISISAHSKKEVAELNLKQIKSREMQTIVRGHGSIVGEACDTGLVIKKISEYPKRTIFVISTRARRCAIPMCSQDVYVELKEERYGEGWARLERIEPVALPPSKMALELFQLFQKQPECEFQQRAIRQEAAFYTLKDIREGIDELLLHNIIVNSEKPFTYRLNIKEVVNQEYFSLLLSKGKKGAQMGLFSNTPIS